MTTKMIRTMKRAKARPNPGRFADALDESRYKTGFARGVLMLRRSELIEWLRKKHPEDKASLKLASKLEACEPNNRCRSAACPECASAAQATVTDIVAQFLKDRQGQGTIVRVSVVPADGIIAPGNLNKADHERAVRRWKDALNRAGVTLFIGGIDWSFNEHLEDRYAAHSSQHLYGFTATDDLEQLKQKLRAQFPKTDAMPRPVNVKPWDGKARAIKYMMKPDFFRRIGTDNAKRAGKDGTGERECRATDKQPLRAEQKHELLAHLDQIGIQGRLLMRWLQFVHLGQGSWAIADRSPKERRHRKEKGWGKSRISGSDS